VIMSTDVQPAPNTSDDSNAADKNADDGEGGIQQPDQMQKTLLNLVFRSMKRTHDMFSNDYTTFPELSEKDLNFVRSLKKRCEYSSVIRHVEEAKKRREQELLKIMKGRGANIPPQLVFITRRINEGYKLNDAQRERRRDGLQSERNTEETRQYLASSVKAIYRI
ncbi:hypothetical protein TELCIR_25401, partial [Teladorsagia circumcincta]